MDEMADMLAGSHFHSIAFGKGDLRLAVHGQYGRMIGVNLK